MPVCPIKFTLTNVPVGTRGGIISFKIPVISAGSFCRVLTCMIFTKSSWLYSALMNCSVVQLLPVRDSSTLVLL